MSVIKKSSQPFEPYARLMNVIGDQLITDKKVAIMEIIKNSYDADAENVEVRFYNMDRKDSNSNEIENCPYIEIEDDGDGMTLDIITNVWMRPATPNKLEKKKNKERRTGKGRVIQGEKGIGRFAIHKLGEKIEVYTKALNENEIKVVFDFEEYNPENTNVEISESTPYKLLKDVQNTWTTNDPPEKIKTSKGTLIRILSLREQWTENDFEELLKSVNRLISPIDPFAAKMNINYKSEFTIKLYNNSDIIQSKDVETFSDVFERAQFRFRGTLTSDGSIDFEYISISPKRILTRLLNILNLKELAANNYDLWAVNDWFAVHNRKISCGEIKFSLYAFDLSFPDKTIITKELKKFIRENFIYVVRDGVRVYPYGEKGIDWLNLDKLRSVVRAGKFPSYNDLIGFIYITQDNNPKLIDSTNRQGLMDIDSAYEDFKNAVTAIVEIFNTEMKIDKRKAKINRNKYFRNTTKLIEESFNDFKQSIIQVEDKNIIEKAHKLVEVVGKQHSLMKEKVEIVEDLAGLGMAVEKSSHDSLMLMVRMRDNIKDLMRGIDSDKYSKDELKLILSELIESIDFVYEEMQIIQPLFKIQRKAIKDVSLIECVEKVVRYFRSEINNKIDIEFIKDKDIIIKTNTGMILQILINLVDNAIYWVNKGDNKVPMKMIFKIDSEENSIIIADSGPGIRDDIIQHIYEEFFSLKSDGRGLGLYIVKEIVNRLNADIVLLHESNHRILPGANFKIKFTEKVN